MENVYNVLQNEIQNYKIMLNMIPSVCVYPSLSLSQPHRQKNILKEYTPKY